MLLTVLCMGDLTAYAMAYFSFMKEEPFLLIKAFSSRIILNNSHHSCLDHVVLNTGMKLYSKLKPLFVWFF